MEDNGLYIEHDCIGHKGREHHLYVMTEKQEDVVGTF